MSAFDSTWYIIGEHNDNYYVNAQIKPEKINKCNTAECVVERIQICL